MRLFRFKCKKCNKYIYLMSSNGKYYHATKPELGPVGIYCYTNCVYCDNEFLPADESWGLCDWLIPKPLVFQEFTNTILKGII